MKKTIKMHLKAK